MSENTICEICNENPAEFEFGVTPICEDCMSDFEDDIGEKGLALAEYLGISPEDVSVSNYDSDTFEIGARMTKRGISPSKAKEDVDALKKKLDAPICGMTVQGAIEWASTQPGYIKCMFDLKAEIRAQFAFAKDLEEHICNLAEKRLPPGQWIYNMYRAGLGFDETNLLYHIFGNDDDAWHVKAYRLAWDNLPIEDTRESYHTNSGEYLVLEEDERDERATEYVRSYVEDVVLNEIPEAYQRWFDTEGFIEHVISTDGYGSQLATYDGEENETTYEGTWFYIYQTN